MSITEFLTARYDEEAAVAAGLDGPSAIPALSRGGMAASKEYDTVYVHPARILADVAAKRAIVEDYATTCRLRDEASERIRAAGDHPAGEDLRSWNRANDEAAVLDQLVMPRLAQPYAEHPDFDPAWRV